MRQSGTRRKPDAESLKPDQENQCVSLGEKLPAVEFHDFQDDPRSGIRGHKTPFRGQRNLRGPSYARRMGLGGGSLAPERFRGVAAHVYALCSGFRTLHPRLKKPGPWDRPTLVFAAEPTSLLCRANPTDSLRGRRPAWRPDQPVGRLSPPRASPAKCILVQKPRFSGFLLKIPLPNVPTTGADSETADHAFRGDS